ncbi:MAG: response regulator [Nitrospirota bacterium]
MTPGKGRVLFMDDEPSIREFAQELLTRLGYEVTCAEHGEQALERFKQARAAGRPFDLVILDLTVRGGMGGKEAIVKLRYIEPDIPAIVSSGYFNDPVMADFSRLGFSARIAKPYTAESLSQIIRTVLESRVPAA